VRAVELALALMAAPRGLDRVRARPLPDGMLAALKAAAGDPLTLADEASRHGCSDREVQEACAIFVQQVLLAEGNDPFRTLGCAPQAPADQLRQHYRWLQRWLHPDRDPEGWVSVYANRVTAAWNSLKRPESRQSVRGAVAVEPPPLVRYRAPYAQPREDDLPDPARRSWVTYLPHAVVGAMLLLVAAVYWANHRIDGLAAVPGGVAMTLMALPPSAAEDHRDTASVAPSEPTVPVPLPAIAAVRPPAVAAMPPEATPRVSEAPLPMAFEPEPPRSEPAVADVPVPEVAELPVPFVEAAPPATVIFAFKDAYERGDLRVLMRLFAGDARTASGSWDATWNDYAALFASTRERSVTLRDLRWERDGEGWIAHGWMDAEVVHEGHWSRQRSGGPVLLRFQPRAGTQRIVGWELGDRG